MELKGRQGPQWCSQRCWCRFGYLPKGRGTGFPLSSFPDKPVGLSLLSLRGSKQQHSQIPWACSWDAFFPSTGFSTQVDSQSCQQHLFSKTTQVTFVFPLLFQASISCSWVKVSQNFAPKASWFPLSPWVAYWLFQILNQSMSIWSSFHDLRPKINSWTGITTLSKQDAQLNLYYLQYIILA